MVAWPNPSYSRWTGGPERCFVEDGLSLRIHAMAKRISRTSGTTHSGSWQWRQAGEICATIGYSIAVDSEHQARLILDFRVNGDPVKQTINLHAEPCRFGGVRWFARCPHTGRTASKLYLPSGGRRFLARQAYRIAYRSQSETVVDRATRRQHKLLRRLKSEWPEVLPKPKGMHWRTYDRLASQVERCENIWAAEAMRRFGAWF